MSDLSFGIESSEIFQRMNRLREALGRLREVQARIGAARRQAEVAEPMTLSARGLAFLEHEEAPRGPLRGPRDDGYGNLTIGYGHKLPRGTQFQGPISPAEARGLLRKDVATAVTEVVKALDVKLTQSQFDALVDFAFNVGGGRRGLLDSTLLRTVNARGRVTERMFAEWDMFEYDEYGGALRKP